MSPTTGTRWTLVKDWFGLGVILGMGPVFGGASRTGILASGLALKGMGIWLHFMGHYSTAFKVRSGPNSLGDKVYSMCVLNG